MAEVILNPVFTSISGTIGRMVFYKRYGRTIVRSWIMPPNPKSPAQQRNRLLFRQAMISWQGLSDEAKAGYNRRARKLSMTGHNLFISEFIKTWNGKSRGDAGCEDGFSPEIALSNVALPSQQAFRSVTAPSMHRCKAVLTESSLQYTPSPIGIGPG